MHSNELEHTPLAYGNDEILKQIILSSKSSTELKAFVSAFVGPRSRPGPEAVYKGCTWSAIPFVISDRVKRACLEDYHTVSSQSAYPGVP